MNIIDIKVERIQERNTDKLNKTEIHFFKKSYMDCKFTHTKLLSSCLWKSRKVMAPGKKKLQLIYIVYYFF